MKGGGSRLNVNTDKPHSLISIKNKVLPTSPPARQSPQAPPTAARARRSAEREPRAAGGAAPPSSGRAPPAARPPPPPRGAPGRTPRATPPPRPPGAGAAREQIPARRSRPAPSGECTLPAAPREPPSPGDSTRVRGDSLSTTSLAPDGSWWSWGVCFVPSGAKEK